MKINKLKHAIILFIFSLCGCSGGDKGSANISTSNSDALTTLLKNSTAVSTSSAVLSSGGE